MVIWKFELKKITDMQKLTMPDGAELLSVANQNGNLCLWAMVDPSNEKQFRYIEVIGTGNPMPEYMGLDRQFIGTVLINPLVWHVFELR
jgi:hypothetical protein